MSDGCQYREHDDEGTCNKVCDPGQRFCPHHLLFMATSGSKEPNWREKTTKDGGIQWTALKTPRGYQE